MLDPLLDVLSVARDGPGRPRKRPNMLCGDKAYSSRAIRVTLRDRGIKAVIPESRDQQHTAEIAVHAEVALSVWMSRPTAAATSLAAATAT